MGAATTSAAPPTASGGGRLRAYLSSALVLALVAWPLTQGIEYDSFPWSSYPMFARDRPQVAVVHHVVAVADDGRHRPIPPPLIANDEVLQAAATIGTAIHRRRSPQLCRQVADRVAADPRWQDFTWLEVATDRYDVLDYFSTSTRPLERDIHARCRIRR
ncbi:MAG: hypothetical protein H6711_14875 [Myxococcales bacterium]|nr:hypothetical protein [Myxococcales bacterium]